MPAHNARCILSRQTIAKGEACHVMLVVQSSTFQPCEVTFNGNSLQLYGGANCDAHPNSAWRAFTPFLRAVYDDYGLSELVLESTLERLRAINVFDDIFTSCAVTAQGSNDCHDHAMDFRAFVEKNAPGLFQQFNGRSPYAGPLTDVNGVSDAELQQCWAYVSDLTRRHRVFTFHGVSQPRPMELCFVHETAYQAMVEHTASQKDDDGQPALPEVFLANSLRERLAAARAEFQESTARGEPPEEARRDALGALFASGEMGRYSRNFRIPSPVLRRGFTMLAVGVYDGKHSEEEYVARLAPWMTDAMVGRAMQYFDLKLEPVAYILGDSSNSVATEYAALVSSMSSKITQDRKQQFA